MKVISGAVLLVFLVIGTIPAEGKVIVVGKDPSADYDNIQTAVDVSVEGDVILVRPGAYRGFFAFKPVTIVGSGIENTLVYRDDFGHAISLGGATGVTTLASFSVLGTMSIQFPTEDHSNILLSDLSLETKSAQPAITLQIYGPGTADVFLQRIDNSLLDKRWSDPVAGLIDGRTHSLRSLSLSQCLLTGADGTPSDGTDNSQAGQSALHLTAVNAPLSLYLANVSANGGRGGDGGHDPSSCEPFFGNRGGDGVEVRNVHALIASACCDTIRGGDGGNGDVSVPCGDTSEGGDGGHGLHDTGDSLIEYTTVSLEGGMGGSGDPPGADGAPALGNAIAVRPIATSEISGSPAIGETFVVTFHGEPGDQVLALLSNRLGHERPPGTEGFPLFVVPGNFFLRLPVGAIDPFGEAVLPLAVPYEPAFRGLDVFVQGLVTSPDQTHRPQITNLSFAVIGE